MTFIRRMIYRGKAGLFVLRKRDVVKQVSERLFLVVGGVSG